MSSSNEFNVYLKENIIRDLGFLLKSGGISKESHALIVSKLKGGVPVGNLVGNPVAANNVEKSSDVFTELDAVAKGAKAAQSLEARSKIFSKTYALLNNSSNESSKDKPKDKPVVEEEVPLRAPPRRVYPSVEESKPPVPPRQPSLDKPPVPSRPVLEKDKPAPKEPSHVGFRLPEIPQGHPVFTRSEPLIPPREPNLLDPQTDSKTEPEPEVEPVAARRPPPPPLPCKHAEQPTPPARRPIPPPRT